MELLFRYNLINNYSETLSTLVGSSTEVTSSLIDSHNDSTSVYVAKSGSDSGTGTAADPFLTIHHALDNLGGKTIITIRDSNSYYTGKSGELTFALSGITLQGEEGQSPTLTIDETVASQIDMLTISSSGKLLNCNVNIPNTYTTQVTGVRFTGSGTMKYCTINGATENGVHLDSSADSVTIESCVIKNCLNWGIDDGNGILVEDGDLTISRTAIYNNSRAGIYSNGSVIKSIDADYCTIAGNYYGYHGSDASNTTETFNDCILHVNKIYDYEPNSGTITNCCIGTVNGSPTLSGLNIRYNPLFVSNTDYQLRSLHNGYGIGDFISPCIDTSSGGIDIGAYNMTRTNNGESYQEFSINSITDATGYETSIEQIDAKKYYLLSQKAKIVSKGKIYLLNLSFDSILQSEYENLKAMYELGGEIYLSIDQGATYKKYLIDTTKSFKSRIPLLKYDMDRQNNISLTLIEVL